MFVVTNKNKRVHVHSREFDFSYYLPGYIFFSLLEWHKINLATLGSEVTAVKGTESRKAYAAHLYRPLMIIRPSPAFPMDDSPRSTMTIAPHHGDSDCRQLLRVSSHDLLKPAVTPGILRIPAVYPPNILSKQIQRPKPIRVVPPSGERPPSRYQPSEKTVPLSSIDTRHGQTTCTTLCLYIVRDGVVEYVPEDSPKRDSTNNRRDVSLMSSPAKRFGLRTQRDSHNICENHHQQLREPELSPGAMTTTPQDHTRLQHSPQSQRNDPTRRPRSRSIAIKRNGHKQPDQDSQTAEIQEESAYDWATWQMYNRIVTYRQKHPVVCTDFENYSQAKSKPTEAPTLLPENPSLVATVDLAPRPCVRFEEEELLEGEIFELEM